MKEKDITKKLLADACDDLNSVMKLDPPIPTDPEDKGVTKATLEADLREAAAELQPDDVLKPKTVEVLEVLGVEVPKAGTGEEVKEAQGEKKEKPETKAPEKTSKAPTKAPEESKKESPKYTRAQAFCDALKGKPKTMEEIAQKAMDLHMAANPGKKQPQLSSIIWAVKDYLQPLIILEVVTIADKKYSLK